MFNTNAIPNSILAPLYALGLSSATNINISEFFIPSKSVLDSNSAANYTIPTLIDIHMASWTNNDDVDPTRLYRELYEDIPIKDKLILLKKGDIDYVMYVYNKKKEPSLLDNYSEYFIKIYNNKKVVIYQINKDQVQLDLQI